MHSAERRTPNAEASPFRLEVRTSHFQGANTGSIPVRDTFSGLPATRLLI